MNINLHEEFPIFSQTCTADKIVLLQVRQVLRQLTSYSYLEIGSYLGGSLTPFLRDEQCEKILSIDDRGRAQPDERGFRADYRDVSHDTMLNKLRESGFSTEKIEVFDGSVDTYKKQGYTYDLIFIDGEHTDWACFRDFVHAERLFKNDCIVLFHDSSLVPKALRMVTELLKARNTSFKFIKVKNSEMSCILLNGYTKIGMENIFVHEENLDDFFAKSEANLLLSSVQNRVTVSFTVKDMPIIDRQN